MVYTCPDCGTTGHPETVDKDTILGSWAVTCADCGTTTLRKAAFASGAVEERRAGVPEWD